MATIKKKAVKKKSVSKKAVSKKSTAKSATGNVDNVKIRMYCLGTGDCFILKFCSGATKSLQ